VARLRERRGLRATSGGDRADIEKSSAVGKEQEQLNSLIAPDDNAVRLERRFQELSAAGRLRLGYGTNHLIRAAGWDAKRQRLGVHVTEVLEALKSIERIGGVTTHQPAGSHPKYGELVRLSCVSSSGRAIALVAQVDRLPCSSPTSRPTPSDPAPQAQA